MVTNMRQNKNAQIKEEISLEEAIHEQKVASEQLYVGIEDGEVRKLRLTGKVNRTQDTKFGRIMYEFELEDEIEGRGHKSIGFNIRNPVTKVLLDRIEAQQLEVTVSRSGSGLDTKYEVRD
jgi:hypothetical protein